MEGQQQSSSSEVAEKKGSSILVKIVRILAVVLVIGIGAYYSLDDNLIDQNNEAIEILDKSGNFEEAAMMFEKSAEEAVLIDNKVLFYSNAGYTHSFSEAYDKATENFQKALDLVSVDSFDYFLLTAEIAVLADKVEDAKTNFGKALEIDPSSYQANNSLGLLYLGLTEATLSSVDYQKALDHIQRAYEQDETETTASNMALAHFGLENYDEAIILFKETNLDEKAYNNYWLGLAYLANLDGDNAKIYLQKADDMGVEMEDFIYEFLAGE